MPDGKDPDEYIRKHGAAAFQTLIEHALPLVDYRLRYVLSHVRYDTLEGKMQALREMLPVLVGIRNAAERSEQTKRLARALLLDEGVVREELAKAQREPQRFLSQPPAREEAAAAVRRAPARRADSALQKAGRIVMRAVWQDATLLAHVEAMIPLEAVPDEVQRSVFLYLRDCAARGEPWDAVRAAAALDEAAAEELSRAIVEGEDAGAAAVAYDDSLRLLRRTYLTARYAALSREAEALSRAGEAEAALAKLAEASKFKEEMDD